MGKLVLPSEPFLHISDVDNHSIGLSWDLRSVNDYNIGFENSSRLETVPGGYGCICCSNSVRLLSWYSFPDNGSVEFSVIGIVFFLPTCRFHLCVFKSSSSFFYIFLKHLLSFTFESKIFFRLSSEKRAHCILVG